MWKMIQPLLSVSEPLALAVYLKKKLEVWAFSQRDDKEWEVLL